MSVDEFSIAAASVPGYLHVRAHRNNQDGYALTGDGRALVAFVCDGCGSTPHPDVGAKLVARFLANRALTLLYSGGRAEPRDLGTIEARAVYLEELRQETLVFLRGIVDALGHNRRDQILDYFLFTVVGTVVTEKTTFIATIGDGVFAVNGAYVEIDQDNQPTYLAYDLITPEIGEAFPGPRTFVEWASLPTGQLRTLLIGSDGAGMIEQTAGNPLSDGSLPGGLAQFHEPRYHQMRFATSKRLTVLGILNRRGGDDITLVALTRKESDHGTPDQT